CSWHLVVAPQIGVRRVYDHGRRHNVLATRGASPVTQQLDRRRATTLTCSPAPGCAVRTRKLYASRSHTLDRPRGHSETACRKRQRRRTVATEGQTPRRQSRHKSMQNATSAMQNATLAAVRRKV